MQFIRGSLIALGLAGSLAACIHAQPEGQPSPQAGMQDEAHLLTFSAQLRGTHEVPPATTLGQGQLDAVLDRNSRQLRWKLQYANLTGPVVGGHFHGPAESGTTAPVVLPLATAASSPAQGYAQLSAAQVDELVAGRWYVNLHTRAFPNGEIRGQLTQR